MNQIGGTAGNDTYALDQTGELTRITGSGTFNPCRSTQLNSHSLTP